MVRSALRVMQGAPFFVFVITPYICSFYSVLTKGVK